MEGGHKAKIQGGINMAKIAEVLETKLKSVQLKYNTLMNTADAFPPNGPSPIQFTTRKKPSPIISVESLPEHNDAIQSAMLKYILDKYGKNGKDILLPKQEDLLPLYIEAYLLKQQENLPPLYIEAYLKQQFIKFKEDDLETTHTILQIVHDAGENVKVGSIPSTPKRRPASMGG
jgi:hypothetical protein